MIILASYLMIVLDISIVITALPKIRQGLGFLATELSWVQTAFTLAFGGLLLLGARAGDTFGRRRMFVVGVGLFTFASLAVGVAQSAVWLVAARAMQGVGAAVLAPSTLALLSTGFREGPERTRAVAYYGAVAGIGASLGLVLGGVITSWLSWRVAFFINVPIGVVMMLAALRYLTETDRRSAQLDVVGALTSTLGMTALVYGMVRSSSAGWTELTVAALASGVVLLALFVVNEWRANQPIMPLRLFMSRERSGAYAARILFLGAMLGFWFFITQFLQAVHGYSPLQAGLAFLPMTLVNFAVAVAVPRLTQKLGNGLLLLAAGMTLTMLGMAWLSRLSAGAPYLTAVALPMILIGAGQGGSLGPLTASGIAGVAPEEAGAASRLVNVAHQLGGSLGLGFLVTVFAAAGGGAPDPRDMLAQRVPTSLTAGTAMLALALVLVLVLIVPRRAGTVAPSVEDAVAERPPLPPLPVQKETR